MSHKHCVFCGEEVLNDGKLTPCNASNNTLPADTVGNRSHAVQSGAPLQPGATQPEHEGVAHKIKELCYWCERPFVDGKAACSHPEMTETFLQASMILDEVEWCDHFCCGMPPKVCRAKKMSAKLTTLLERMARLVVEEAARAICVHCANRGRPERSALSGFWWHGDDACKSGDIWDIDKPKKFQQLREAVERP